MSKKSDRRAFDAGVIHARGLAAAAENERLRAQLAATATPAPAAPPPPPAPAAPPPRKTWRDAYRELRETNPYAAANLLLNAPVRAPGGLDQPMPEPTPAGT